MIQLLLVGMLAFSLPPLLLTLGSFVYFQTNDRILPGVFLDSQDLSWKTVSEVEQLIDERWNQDDVIAIVDLDDPQRSWTDYASSFGLSVDSSRTAYAAYRQGREGQGFQTITNMLTTLRSGASVEYVVVLDVVQAKTRLEAWAERAYIPVSDDAIAMDGREILVSKARDGKEVDVLASLDLLIEDTRMIRMDHQMIPLVVNTIPSQTDDTQRALTQLQEIVEADVSLRAYDPVTDEQFEWRPSDEEFERWIEIAATDHGFDVKFVNEEIRAFVDRINTNLGPERFVNEEQATINLTGQLSGSTIGSDLFMVEYLPSTFQVQPGDNLISISFEIGLPYWKLFETNPDLATRGLVVGEELIVPPKDDMLELPVIPNKRITISILDQTMRVYQDRELLYEHIISTGIPNSPTLPGIFQVKSHHENAYASIWDLYMPHFLGIYDAVPGLTNGIHGLPLLSSGRRLWADVLGSPASYGCIILDLEAAETLYYWAEEGVVVEIR